MRALQPAGSLKLRRCMCREAANAWGLQCMRYEIRDITGASLCRCC